MTEGKHTTSWQLQVGFEPDSVKSAWTDQCPEGAVPIVNLNSPFAFGEVIGVAIDEKSARRLVLAWNSFEELVALAQYIDDWHEMPSDDFQRKYPGYVKESRYEFSDYANKLARAILAKVKKEQE